MAFAKAAFAAGSDSARPITVACSAPPSSAIVCRPSVAVPVAWAASPQPSVSSRWCFASSAGTSASASAVANPASLSAAFIGAPLRGAVALGRWRASLEGPLHRPVLVGTGKRVLHLGRAALVDHERASELDHHLTPLVDAAAAHGDDADARVGARLAQVDDLALRVQR